jgi:hypothetical protein
MPAVFEGSSLYVDPKERRMNQFFIELLKAFLIDERAVELVSQPLDRANDPVGVHDDDPLLAGPHPVPFDCTTCNT